MSDLTYCGYVALVGRPNVGKSTLLNTLLEQKLSITSRKPQTTRHRILGISTEKTHQFIYVDTPGIHGQVNKAVNRLMNKAADYALFDVDSIVFVIEGTRLQDDDMRVLEKLKRTDTPVVLAINMVDKIKDKSVILPHIEKMKASHEFKHIIPLSAKTGFNVDQLKQTLNSMLPQGPHLFSSEQITDRPTKFLLAEFVREKVFRLCGQELPYSVTVDIENVERSKDVCRIDALILVDKENHKRMIIGKGGRKLKEIGTAARADIENLLETKVFLKLWVKVKQGWSDDERVLKQLGYDD